MGNWRCVSTLKGDGTQVLIEACSTTSAPNSPIPNPNASTSRFVKLGGAAAAAAGKFDVPWH